ncbi:MAG: trypsin-like peptidase domain-containing protein [Proteobacteria bacterium]|nr:trypsin-like peptidase domain-containing protein [Pseudomonadota bacterium]
MSGPVDRATMEMVVFPIIKVLFLSDGTEVHKLVGTGFFLNENGLFLSARHVFQGRECALDLEGADGFAVYCIHAVNLNRKMVLRHIDVQSIKTRNDTDIAAGYVEKNQFGRANAEITESELQNTAHINFTTKGNLPIGTDIWTVAYPLMTLGSVVDGGIAINFQSDMFRGRITAHYQERRDAGLLNWPCYETDMQILGGASGGPVFVSGSSGVVFAVNCSGTTPHTVSHVSSLRPAILAGEVNGH